MGDMPASLLTTTHAYPDAWSMHSLLGTILGLFKLCPNGWGICQLACLLQLMHILMHGIRTASSGTWNWKNLGPLLPLIVLKIIFVRLDFCGFRFWQNWQLSWGPCRQYLDLYWRYCDIYVSRTLDPVSYVGALLWMIDILHLFWIVVFFHCLWTKLAQRFP